VEDDLSNGDQAENPPHLDAGYVPVAVDNEQENYVDNDIGKGVSVVDFV